MNFFSLVYQRPPHVKPGTLREAIDLAGMFKVETEQGGNWAFGAAYRQDSPLKGKRIYQDKDWVMVFAGDIVDHPVVPFAEFRSALESRDHTPFSGLNGYFALAAFHQTDQKLYVVSDRTSQYPVYYHLGGDWACISSDMATFCRLDLGFGFNPEWLWEYLYFNFPIGDTSFLTGVKRLPPATILEFDPLSGRHVFSEYARLFQKAEPLLGEEESLEVGAEIFGRRFPKYYAGSPETACALTNGWDARNVLALSPDREAVTTYTYGPPESSDIRGARKTARRLGQKHLEIPLDDRFVSDLPRLSREVVYLTSGAEKVLRSSLLHVYGTLTGQGSRFPLTMSGIALSGIFRGHMLSPVIISADLTRLLEGGDTYLDEEAWAGVFKGAYPEFKGHISGKLEALRSRFGDFRDTLFHLYYLIYCLSPMHFCGEIKTAGFFTTVRVPGWDPEVQELAFRSVRSALSYSERQGQSREGRQEVVLQSYILTSLAPHFGRIPVQNTRPDIVLKGGMPYLSYRLLNSLRNRFLYAFDRRTASIRRDGWERWVNQVHPEFFDGLIFAEDSHLRQYFTPEYLERLKSDRNLQDIGKLGTVEIILRLIASGWKRYW